MTVIRYTIELERDISDDGGPGEGDYHDGSDSGAIGQVAKELQEAMDMSGLPVGTFNIVKREVRLLGGNLTIEEV